jgi:hypothetical protein
VRISEFFTERKLKTLMDLPRKYSLLRHLSSSRTVTFYWPWQQLYCFGQQTTSITTIGQGNVRCRKTEILNTKGTCVKFRKWKVTKPRNLKIKEVLDVRGEIHVI